MGLPETDMVWHSLLSLNLSNSDLNNYPYNRVPLTDLLRDLQNTSETLSQTGALMDFEFYLWEEMEKWYNENHNKGIDSKEYVLGKIYSEGSSESELIGEMVASYDANQNKYLLYGRSGDISRRIEVGTGDMEFI